MITSRSIAMEHLPSGESHFAPNSSGAFFFSHSPRCFTRGGEPVVHTSPCAAFAPAGALFFVCSSIAEFVSMAQHITHPRLI
jgi:hypothetical protein